MDRRQLKYFVAVAEKLSFTDAAKTLFVAQSAVSQQILELEKELGVTLFRRNRRSVQLTAAGNTLYCEATGLLKRFDEVAELTKSAHMGFHGHLRIGYIGYGDRKWLPGVLKTFTLRYPQITLEVNRYHQGALTKALNEDALDIAVTFSFGIDPLVSQPLTHQHIETHHVYTETLCAVVSKGHPLAETWAQQKMPLGALEGEAFILQNRHESPQGFDKTLQLCMLSGFSPRIVATPNLVQTALLLVESEIGVAILPSSLKDYAGPELVFIPLALAPEHAQYAIVAAWKAGNVNPVLDQFKQLIKEESDYGA